MSGHNEQDCPDTEHAHCIMSDCGEAIFEMDDLFQHIFDAHNPVDVVTEFVTLVGLHSMVTRALEDIPEAEEYVTRYVTQQVNRITAMGGGAMWN